MNNLLPLCEYYVIMSLKNSNCNLIISIYVIQYNYEYLIFKIWLHNPDYM